MLVLLCNVLPHDIEDRCTDEGVLDSTRKEERAGVRQQLAHDVVLAMAQAHLKK